LRSISARAGHHSHGGQADDDRRRPRRAHRLTCSPLQDSDPKPKAAVATSSSSLKPAASGGLGFGTILFVGMVAVGAYMAYQSLNQDSTKA
jgi:hypothetical protein